MKCFYKKHMKEMQDLDTKAWKFLEKKDPRYFCRLYFSTHAKCESIDSNIAEIFNGSIVKAKYLPVVSMLKEIFTKEELGCQVRRLHIP